MWEKNGLEVFLSREKIDESKYGLDIYWIYKDHNRKRKESKKNNPNFVHGPLIYKCRNNNYESMRSILVNKNIYIYIYISIFCYKIKINFKRVTNLNVLFFCHVYMERLKMR
jgi:hypothetical protein